MKNKRVKTLAMATILMGGCADRPSSETIVALQTKFFTHEVYEVPHAADVYMVRDTNGTVWCVDHYSFSNFCIKIFPAQ